MTKVQRAPGERKASHRLALKIAARSSLRSVGRSALIAAMVALPVAGLAGIAVVYDSAKQPTVEETLTTVLGQTEAQLVVSTSPTPNLVQDPHSHDYEITDPMASSTQLASPVDVLPASTRILELRPTSVTADTAAGRATFDVLEGESWHESLAGRYNVTDGRGPRTDREIMVTASLLPRLDAKIGDTVQLRSPVTSTVTIVGVLDDQTRADADEVIFTRSGVISGGDSPATWDTAFYLPDTVLTWDDVRELNTHGITAISRDVLLNGPAAVDLGGSSSSIWAVAALVAMFGGFAAFEVILLAGAAFTVTARQQQRMLATIASVGAPRRLLFRILAANGVVLGALGGILGCLVGVVAAIAYMAITDDGSATQYYGIHVPWLALLGCIAFAVTIGWLSSLAPARNASRFDIVAALRGARKPPTPNTRTPVIGVVMMVSGLVLTVGGGVLLSVLVEAGRGTSNGHPLLWLPIAMMIVGPILIQVGLMLCGPLLLRIIARGFGRGGIGVRLASRDAARNPSRAVPAVAAIMTTVFVSIVAMCLISAGEENSRQEHVYSAVLGQVRVDLRYLEHEGSPEIWTMRVFDDPQAVTDILRTTLDVQEALPDQASVVRASLGEHYKRLGHGRNTNRSGEGCPIYVDTRRFEILHWEQLWLSETPTEPGSHSWGNQIPRILVSVRLRDRVTGHSLHVINTHFDHRSRRSRVTSAALVASLSDESTIITGDFNSAVDTLPFAEFAAGGFADTWDTADRRLTAEWGTYPNYRAPRLDRKRIDWILGGAAIQPSAVGINTARFAGVAASDHLPVQAVVRVTGSR